jgi:putative endonuclease
MSYYVYILESNKDGRHYIGSTTNVEKRLLYHNLEKQRSTKNRIPFKFIYNQKCSDKKTALQREKQIKSYKGGEAFKKLIIGV